MPNLSSIGGLEIASITHLKTVDSFNLLLQSFGNQSVLLDHRQALELFACDDDSIEGPATSCEENKKYFLDTLYKGYAPDTSSTCSWDGENLALSLSHIDCSRSGRPEGVATLYSAVDDANVLRDARGTSVRVLEGSWRMRVENIVGWPRTRG